MRWLLLPIALSAMSPAAFGMDPSLRGFYIGGGVGEATVELEDDDSAVDFKGDDTGHKLIAGYRIIDWVAVEANYANYGEARDTLFGFEFESDFKALSVSGLGMLPLGNFDLFGRLGVARVDGTFRAVRFNASTSDESTQPIFGLGGQYRHDNLGFRVEWEAIELGFDDDGDDERDGDDWVELVSVAVTYKF